MGIEGEPIMPDPTPENVEKVLRDVETATKEVETAEKQKVPDYGLGQYNAPIAEAIQKVEQIHEKNQRSADEIAEMLGQTLRSMPPEKSQKIFKEVYTDILKSQQPPTRQKIKGPSIGKDEFKISEDNSFREKQKKCLDYLDQLAKKGRFFTELRKDIEDGQEFDVRLKLEYYENTGLTQEEAYTLSKLFNT
ncbi:MAG: hypothetical protein WC657_00710 [Candidatus Paceibacterota bacterium]|jgi:hypothetical protein